MKKHSFQNGFVTIGLLLTMMVPVAVNAQGSVGPVERALEEHKWESVEAGGVRVFF